MKIYLNTIYRYQIFVLILLISVSSCEKEIELDLPDSEQYIVIDGWIRKDSSAKVLLTRSTDFFEILDSLSFRKLIVTTAKVTLHSPDESEVLTLVRDYDYFPPFVYKSFKIKGELGKDYILEIETGGKKYTSTTQIKKAVELDSLWFESVERDSIKILWGKISDPKNESNFYRLFTKRLGIDEQFKPTYGATWSDEFFNGLEFNFPIYQASKYANDPNLEIGFNAYSDTVVVELNTIDKHAFRFWSKAEKEMYMGKNPFFISEFNITTNINGGAIGVWCGYHPTYDTIYPQKKITKNKKP